MRRITELLILLPCLSCSLTAQTRDGCHEAVQHLTLPATAELPAMHPGLPLSPIQFLYSSRGIDFYSVLFRLPNYRDIVGDSVPSVSLVLVYQDEGVRQEMIGSLRDAKVAVRESDGTPPSLENLKFAVVHCAVAGKEFADTGRCKPDDIDFFKPQACVVVPQTNSLSDLSILAGSGARSYRDALNPLNLVAEINYISYITAFAGGKPLYFDVPKDMRHKLKEFLAQNESR